LLKLVAIAAHAAAVTLQLLQARDGRSGEPASVALTTDELGTLDALHTQYSGRTPRQQNPHPRHSLAWAAWLIARLGGWEDTHPRDRPAPSLSKSASTSFASWHRDGVSEMCACPSAHAGV